MEKEKHDDILNALTVDTKESDFVQKLEDDFQMPADIAKLIYQAWNKGIDFYFNPYFEQKERADKYEYKYRDLAIKVCEKLI